MYQIPSFVKLSDYGEKKAKNAIDKKNAKKNKKGEIITMLPNDVLAKADDIFLWRVNNSQFKDWWKRTGKDQNGFFE